MTKNSIGLHNLFAILGLGVSLLLLGFGGQFILQMNRYESYDSPVFENLLAFGFTGAGFCCLLFSIGLIMRMQWAKTAFQVMLILGGLAWLVFMVSLFRDSPNAWAVLVGMTAFGVTVVLFGILLLESPHFLHDLQQQQSSDRERLDILDH